MRRDALPLFYQQPTTCMVVAFPLHRRVGKIRDVASKMRTKTTEKHVAGYREQVTSALVNQLERAGFPETERAGQLSAFWRAVGCEMARQRHHDGAA